MIVQQSDVLLAALDRRLQVDRMLPLDALASETDASRQPPDSAARSPAGAPPIRIEVPVATETVHLSSMSPGPNALASSSLPSSPLSSGLPASDLRSSAPGSAAPPSSVVLLSDPRSSGPILTSLMRSSPTAAIPPTSMPLSAVDLQARLPLGRVVTAHVIGAATDGHVIADIGEQRVALAWPANAGAVPDPGRDVSLRVLAHRPVLLFESVAAETDVEAVADDPVRSQAPVRWSGDAMRLQAAAPSDGASPARGVLRFDVPILDIEVVPDDAASTRASATSSPSRAPSPATERSTFEGPDPSAAGVASAEPNEADSVHRPVAQGDHLVVHGEPADGIPALRIAPAGMDEAPAALPFPPLVLHGPAWPGQTVELVIRRERDDEAFDNPVLDHWCGEVVIDLPQLGRVAGHLSFSLQGLRVRLEADDEASVRAMSAVSGELATALAKADLRVAGLTVGHPTPDSTRPDPWDPRVVGPTASIDRHG